MSGDGGSATIVTETVIRAPIDRVFEALVTPEQLALWWDGDASWPNLGWSVDARAGGRWVSRWRKPPGGEEVEMGGRILEYDPPHRMVWSWMHDAFPEAGESRVEYTLEEVGEGVRLRIEHSAFRESAEVGREGYVEGWRDVLERIRVFVERRTG